MLTKNNTKISFTHYRARWFQFFECEKSKSKICHIKNYFLKSKINSFFLVEVFVFIEMKGITHWIEFQNRRPASELRFDCWSKSIWPSALDSDALHPVSVPLNSLLCNAFEIVPNQTCLKYGKWKSFHQTCGGNAPK